MAIIREGPRVESGLSGRVLARTIDVDDPQGGYQRVFRRGQSVPPEFADLIPADAWAPDSPTPSRGQFRALDEAFIAFAGRLSLSPESTHALIEASSITETVATVPRELIAAASWWGASEQPAVRVTVIPFYANGESLRVVADVEAAAEKLGLVVDITESTISYWRFGGSAVNAPVVRIFAPPLGSELVVSDEITHHRGVAELLSAQHTDFIVVDQRARFGVDLAELHRQARA